MIMIKKDRLLNTFLDLVQIDSISLREKKMSDAVCSLLKREGLEPFVDDIASTIQGETGNVICHLKGDASQPSIMLCAHLDTVEPGLGKKPRVSDGYVYSDGNTVLGSDDIAGVSIIIESLRALIESGEKHGDIWAVFTVAEEIGLLGSKNINVEELGIKPDYCFVLDSGGSIGTADIKGPFQNQIKMIFKGKAAHAGLEPEKGVNAIKVAARAVDKMPSGRISSDTTSNVGIISGGRATNIVCDEVIVEAEVRSLVKKNVENISREMSDCAKAAVEFYPGSSVDIQIEEAYPGFNIKESEPIIELFKKACNKVGIKYNLVATGGGSDTNILNGKGITTINVSVGMDLVHTNEERIKLRIL